MYRKSMNNPSILDTLEEALKKLEKVSSLKLDHPVRQWIVERKIPSQYHYLLYFAPKFYQWVNTIIENKFPSLEKDHPRLVIPFFEKNKMFALQGRAFGDENPKYITIKLQDKDKIFGLERVDWKKTVYVCEALLTVCLWKIVSQLHSQI